MMARSPMCCAPWMPAGIACRQPISRPAASGFTNMIMSCALPDKEVCAPWRRHWLRSNRPGSPALSKCANEIKISGRYYVVKRRLGLLLAVVAALVGAEAFSTRAAEPAKELTIPVLLPLTGPPSFIGQQEKEALDIGANVLTRDGNPVELVYQDDQASPQIAVQL